MKIKNKKKYIFLLDENLPILLNGKNHSGGGATVQTSNWQKGFEKNGFKTVVISPIKLNNKYNFLVESIPKKSLFTPFKFFIVLLKYIPKFVYISIPWWSNFLLYIPAKFLSIKITQRISNDIFVDDRVNNVFSSNLKRILFHQSLKLVDIYICQNSYQQQRMKEIFPKKKVLKFYNPIDTSFKKYNFKRSYIAWVGIFQKQKNLSALLSIAIKLSNYKFMIAGEELESIDSETSEILKLIKKLNNVEFVGMLSRDEIFIFLSKAHCLLNTSHYEGFPNTYLEAISVRTPIVTRKITDPDNIITNNRLGVCADSFDEIPTLIKNIINKKYNFGDFQHYLQVNHDASNLATKLINKIN